MTLDHSRIWADPASSNQWVLQFEDENSRLIGDRHICADQSEAELLKVKYDAKHGLSLLEENAKSMVYRPQRVPSNSYQFKRWLVVVDVIPDLGEIDGFQYRKLGRRTLQMVAYRLLNKAVDLISGLKEILRGIEKEGRRDATFVGRLRYRFFLIDLAQHVALTPKTIDEGHIKAFSRPGMNVQSAIYSFKKLRGFSEPQTVTFEGLDIIKLLRPVLLNKPLKPLVEEPKAYRVSNTKIKVEEPEIKIPYIQVLFDEVVSYYENEFFKWVDGYTGISRNTRQVRLSMLEYLRATSYVRNRVVSKITDNVNESNTRETEVTIKNMINTEVKPVVRRTLGLTRNRLENIPLNRVQP